MMLYFLKRLTKLAVLSSIILIYCLYFFLLIFPFKLFCFCKKNNKSSNFGDKLMKLVNYKIKVKILVTPMPFYISVLIIHHINVYCDHRHSDKKEVQLIKIQQK